MSFNHRNIQLESKHFETFSSLSLDDLDSLLSELSDLSFLLSKSHDNSPIASLLSRQQLLSVADLKHHFESLYSEAKEVYDLKYQYASSQTKLQNRTLTYANELLQSNLYQPKETVLSIVSLCIALCRCLEIEQDSYDSLTHTSLEDFHHITCLIDALIYQKKPLQHMKYTLQMLLSKYYKMASANILAPHEVEDDYNLLDRFVKDVKEAMDSPTHTEALYINKLKDHVDVIKTSTVVHLSDP